MRVAITGGTGFVGRALIRQLAAGGHTLRCWHRPESDLGGLKEVQDRVEWVPGHLADTEAAHRLVHGCDAVVHAALWRPGDRFRGGEGDIVPFVQTNVVGTLQLIEAARNAAAGRFVFISTCAVHEVILDDRPLDEAHPCWPASHYGAHKAAIEAFVHSYARQDGYNICALRPTGIYGVARPVAHSKWYELVSDIVQGRDVTCRGGGKEVHVRDVARAVELLLSAESVAGEVFNCYDQYVPQYDVAVIAKNRSGSPSTISGEPTRPKHQIATDKICSLGMQFGGRALLEQTIHELVAACQ